MTVYLFLDNLTGTNTRDANGLGSQLDDSS